MSKLHLQLLGSPKISWENGSPPRFRSQRTVALLGYLVTEQRAVSRDFLAVLFWPDEPLARGKANLRRELYNLARILPGCWQTSRFDLFFAPNEETAVDITQFLQHRAAGQWQAAADLIGGVFLEGITLATNLEFEIWLLGEQERWRQRFEYILNRLIKQRSQQAQYTEALHHARQLLQIMPWNENAHRHVMILLARTGQQSAALRQYQLCQMNLQEELGVKVSRETTQLYERIKSHSSFIIHHTPTFATPFIGREKEIFLLKTWLETPTVRLITIVGLGGMGKTRLALEAVSRYQRTTADEIYFISLVGTRTQGDLVRTIAAAIGLPFSGRLEPEQQLLSGLRRRSLIMVLDSFEHLLNCADLIGRLLVIAPGVRLVVTSRERLNFQYENLLSLQGLDQKVNDRLENSSAYKLFIKAAQRQHTPFQANPIDSTYIDQICHLVAGMPLAIELAASWTAVLPPKHILQEIKSSLAILARQFHDLPDRHWSIRAAFTYSWDMLRKEERTTLKKLSIFAGGFDLTAAQVVAGATIFILSRLVDKSLVSQVGAARYQMHELLRQFAAERLAANSEEQQQTLDQHCRYYTDLLSQYEYDSKTNFASISNSLLKTQADIDNVLAAWSHARRARLIPKIGKLAYFQSLFYEFFELRYEGKTTFGDALQCLREQPEQVNPIIWMRVLTHYGWFCHALFELTQARAALEEALIQSSALVKPHHADVGLLHVFLGWVIHLQDQSANARWHLERGLLLCQVADYQLGQLMSHHMLGEIAYDAGHYTLALKYHRQVVTQFPKSQYHILLTLGFLSISYTAVDNYVAAANHIRKLLDALIILPNILSGLLALTAIAALYGHKGQAEQAVCYAALALNHPQMGGLARYKAETVLNELRALVSEEVFSNIIQNATQNHPPNLHLEPDFRIDSESISKLKALLEQAVED